MSAKHLDPADMDAATYLRWERIGWLRTLVGSYRELRAQIDKADQTGVYADDDPAATAEALAECEALADELEAGLPPPGPEPAGLTPEQMKDVPF